MLSELKKALLEREYHSLSEELDEMIFLDEDEDLFSFDELGLSENVQYEEDDFADIPEDEMSLDDDDIDVLLDEETQNLDNLMEETLMTIYEYDEFEYLTEDEELLYESDDEFDYSAEDYDFEADEDEDDDLDLSECVDYIYLTESDECDDLEYDDETENDAALFETDEFDYDYEEDEDLSESVFFDDFMDM